MNTEINSLIARIKTVNTGTPWYGRPVFELLEEISPAKASAKPASAEHSMLELLWHMNTWATFTLARIEKKAEPDMPAFEALDWRKLNPQKHTWAKGLEEFKAIQRKIISRLRKKEDLFLDTIVEYRKYNFRFLINGMIEHNIYHLGQIALLSKMIY